MELENKKTISVYGSILGLVALMCLSAFSYAYFAVNSTPTNSLNIVASVSGDYLPVFTASSSGNLSLNITDADMMNNAADTNNTTIAGTANQTLKVTMTGGSSSKSATCSFDFVWTNTGTAYSPSSGLGSLKEYTIKIMDGNTSVYSENQISNLTSGSTIKSTSITSSGTSVTKNYVVTVTVYNLNLLQSIAGKTYSSRVDIKNVVCR